MLRSHIPFYSFLLTALLCLGGTNLYADGDGVRGGGFSANTPQYDPVEEYKKGLAELDKGDFKAAEKAFRRVLKVTKKDANSHYFLGVALVHQNKYKKARSPLKKAIKYDEGNILARGYLAKAYVLSKKPKKAAKQKAVLEKLKSSCQGCAEAKTIQQAIGIANETAAEASKFNSTHTNTTGQSNYLSAVQLINRGLYQEALAELKVAALAAGPHPDILTYQGFANRKLGHYETAVGFYRAALTIDNNHRGANEYLGEFYVETKQLDLAEQQLIKLQQICPFGCEEAEELQRWLDAART